MIIYTDSSWKDNKCGYALSCSMTTNKVKPTFIYGNCLAETSTEAEMIAVIKAMEYIKQYYMQLNNIKYEIRVDEQWIDSIDSDIVSLPVEDIFITELEHLKCKRIDFNGVLAKVNKENEITTPVAVRRIAESNKYSLVAGIKRLFSAKILGIKTIPAIITEIGHSEFVEKYR